MSEVNAYLLWRHFIRGAQDLALYDFRSRLAYQLLNHPTYMRERSEGMHLRERGRFEEVEHTLEYIHEGPRGKQGRCRMCGCKTYWRCVCLPNEPRHRFPCCPAKNGSTCFSRHCQGEKPVDRRSVAQSKRQEALRTRRAGQQH